MLTVCSYRSPVGPLRLVGTEHKLTRVLFGDRPAPEGSAEGETPLLLRAAGELDEYFSGKRKYFTVPVLPLGTPFQQAVWTALQEIPWGRTVSYRDIAGRIGKPSAARAVGRANGQNPIPIFIPCHRVISADGSPGGYSLGLDVKRQLLKLEGVSLP